MRERGGGRDDIVYYPIDPNVVTIATIEYEAQLRHKNEMTRLEAELRGKYVYRNIVIIQDTANILVVPYPPY